MHTYCLVLKHKQVTQMHTQVARCQGRPDSGYSTVLPNFKRAKLCVEEERLAAQNEDEKKASRARAEEASLAEQKQLLKQVLVNSQHATTQKEKHVFAKIHKRWLQTMYPAKKNLRGL